MNTAYTAFSDLHVFDPRVKAFVQQANVVRVSVLVLSWVVLLGVTVYAKNLVDVVS